MIEVEVGVDEVEVSTQKRVEVEKGDAHKSINQPINQSIN